MQCDRATKADLIHFALGGGHIETELKRRKLGT